MTAEEHLQLIIDSLVIHREAAKDDPLREAVVLRLEQEYEQISAIIAAEPKTEEN